ncbi:hypothetical protein C7H19_12975 [Aphanothece hegewaldii CCALA 016]|uniref:Uncharacterized protein n=1 Tax=Aphanothece hegewaldii CCALA 016 TaxID=2107694 RepID=A0A2T1LWQ3_9CHRO|nr:hypothetical protein [Aphanothece hegewaldii]PSF36588.1 hypothetical protein C7H19_12975 [Aphanothece hegewaldii CCALA 016]
MKLKKQLKILADEAPQYGIPFKVMEKAVIPVLVAFAQQLRHEEYYILQNKAGDWIINTLSHRHQPKIEKKVIYAFSTSQDAAQYQNTANSVAIPVTHLLFQLFALGQIDSIVFLEKSGNLNDGVEISRTEIQTSLQHQLKQLKDSFSTPSNLA